MGISKLPSILTSFTGTRLHWRQVRKLLYVALLADSVYFLVGVATQTPIFSPLPAFGAILVVLAFTITALAVSAARTSDRTIKRHVRFFWIFLVGFLAALYTSQLGIALVVNLASDLIIVAATYSLFLMVMSLSPIGRLEKEGANKRGKD